MGPLRINSASFLAHWHYIALAIVTFLATAVFLRYLWREWTMIAMVGVVFYFLGGRYIFPWGTPWRRAVAIGIFLGVLFSTVEFFYNPVFT